MKQQAQKQGDICEKLAGLKTKLDELLGDKTPVIEELKYLIADCQEHINTIQEERNLFYRLFEDSADATLLIDSNKFVDCNAATLTMLKMESKNEVFNTHPSELSPEYQPDGQKSEQKSEAMIGIAMKKGSHRFEWLHKKADGTLFYAEVLLTKVMYGRKSFLHCVWRDMTDKKIADDALKLSEESYKFLFDEAADGILVGNYTGEIIKANARMEKITGYAIDELIGSNISSLFPSDVLKDKPLRYDLLKDGNVVLFERDLKKKNGEIITIEMNTKVVEKDILQAYIRDITERKKQEKKIIDQNVELAKAQSELKGKNELLSELNGVLQSQKDDLDRIGKMLKLVIDHIPVGVFWKDLKLNYLGANHVFLKNAGLSTVEQIIGKSDFDLAHEQMANKYRSDDKQVIDSGTPMMKIEEKLTDAHGGFRIVLTNKVPMLNEKNEIIGVLGSYEDITEMKSIQEKLWIAKEKAEESDRLKTAFLANMSHEIRTPMNGILGFAQVLQDHSLSPEKQDRFLKIIHQSGSQLLGIINDLVDISKIEAGQMTVNTEQFCVNEIIREQMEFFQLEAKEKGIRLSQHLGLPDLEAVVVTDKLKFKQVLTNLTKNALKFTLRDGEVKISYNVNENHLLFAVKDTGVGIAKEFQAFVFERFHQSRDAVSSGYNGSGLGLAICKAFVGMCGGKIWFESEFKKGTTFYFTIPYSQ